MGGNGASSRLSAGGGSLPSLRGSEKQIAWATEIRNDAYENLSSIANPTARITGGTTIKSVYHTKNGMTATEKEVKAATKEVKNTIDTFFKSTVEAGRVIDKRNILSYESLKDAVDSTILKNRR